MASLFLYSFWVVAGPSEEERDRVKNERVARDQTRRTNAPPSSARRAQSDFKERVKERSRRSNSGVKAPTRQQSSPGTGAFL
jgi:hypothetical protein